MGEVKYIRFHVISMTKLVPEILLGNNVVEVFRVALLCDTHRDNLAMLCKLFITIPKRTS